MFSFGSAPSAAATPASASTPPASSVTPPPEPAAQSTAASPPPTGHAKHGFKFGSTTGQQQSVDASAMAHTSDQAFGSYATGSSVIWPQQSTSSADGSSMSAPGLPTANVAVKAESMAVAAVSTGLHKKTVKKVVSALAIDEGEGFVAFPSHKDSEFRYRLAFTKTERLQVWIEDRTSKHQWESKELELSDIVSGGNAIPMMELKDYFESFKSCLLAAETGLYPGANKHDLIVIDDSKGSLQLELTLSIQIFTKVLTPMYKFKLYPVKLSEIDILSARLRDQDLEISELRAEVQALSSKVDTSSTTPLRVSGRAFADATPVYYRAETVDLTLPNQVAVWHETDYGTGFSSFEFMLSGAIRFKRAGLYSIQIGVHHTNFYNPNTVRKGFGWTPSPETEAFQLLKNGQNLASSFGSSVHASTQSTSLAHILYMEENEEISVLYTGTGVAKKGSYIVIHKVN